MPRYYTNGRRCQMNLTLDADAYEILETLSPNKRAYGHLISRMLRDLQRTREETQLCERMEASVRRLEALAGPHA
jgi:hypothetical protein